MSNVTITSSRNLLRSRMCWCISSWVHQELRRGLSVLTDLEYGRPCARVETDNRQNFPQSSDVVALLTACAKHKDLHYGSRVHSDILKSGSLDKNCYVASCLVNMYAKCGALAEAVRVLDELPVRDAVSWNALIAGYAQHGQGKEALKCLKQMQQEGLSPNAVTFTCILKACGHMGAVDEGEQIHNEIIRRGILMKDTVLGTTLVHMYAKCGALAKAVGVFDDLCVRDVIVWNAIITGYVQHGQSKEALKCFEQMQQEGVSPNTVSFICILKACGNIGAADMGERIHDKLSREGLLGKSIVLDNALVDMYTKCGALAKAAGVLDKLPIRDVVSWSVLITGYAQQGLGEEALKCFERMQCEGFFPNTVTFVSLLKACGSFGAADKGEEIHQELIRQGLLGKDVTLGNALVDMYVKCGALAKAAQVLDELPVRDVVTWSALMAGYVQQGQGDEAMACFVRLQSEGLLPNIVTYTCILKAYGSMGATDKGEQIHNELVRQGLLGKDAVLGNALVDMYVKCGAFAKAAQVLGELPVKDAVSWNTLIAGFVLQGQNEEALKFYKRMQHEGVCPDAVTFISILKACASIGAVDKGKQIHDEIVSWGFLGKDVSIGNSLVDMYAKCGALTKAARVLSELHVQDVVSWNSIISGYAQQEQGEEALKCFEWMQREGISPDAVTFICILKACGSIGAADKGKQIHDEVLRCGYLGKDIVLGNTLVDMYAKCGALAKAARVLEDLPVRDVVSWNVLIAGYAQQGQGEEALKCLEQMQNEGIFPDPITLACVLCACSRSGLTNEGQKYFVNVSKNGRIRPDAEHHTCMVDLFGRAGEFDKAVEVIKRMPSSSYLPVWLALLAACRESGHVKLGSVAFHNAVQISKSDSAAYILISKLYAAAGMQRGGKKHTKPGYD